jgi:integrase
MTWDGARKRWAKMHRGRRFVISCKALGRPETKEESYQAANAWWATKRAELDGYTLTPPKPLPGTPEARRLLLEAWAGGPLESEEAMSAALLDMMEHFKDKPLPAVVQQAVLGPERVAAIKTAVEAALEAPAAPPGRSIKAHAEAWRRTQEARVAAGLLSAGRAANNLGLLAHLQAFTGPDADVAALDAGRLQGYYEHCLSRVAARRTGQEDGWSLAYAKDVFAVAKTFIRWLWEAGQIDLPKNIGSKAFRFGAAIKAVKTWTPDEFRTAVQAARGKLRLALLLMANCGMTQQDVSDLADDEVDWGAGRVKRQRSKTAGNENVPTVDYLLWPSTFALLKQYRSGTERVLLTEGGLPYLRTNLRAGRLSKADGFASSWVHVKRRLGLNRPLKQLRKLGATLLEGHPVYGRFTSYFLGHSPRTVAARHYAAPSQELFDEAVAWLGSQLGQI